MSYGKLQHIIDYPENNLTEYVESNRAEERFATGGLSSPFFQKA